MAVVYEDHIDLTLSEIRNALVHPVAADPDFTGVTDQGGRIWYNSTEGKLKYRDDVADVVRTIGEIVVDGVTIEVSGGALRLKDGGVTNAKVAAAAGIDRSKLALNQTDQALRYQADQTASSTANPAFATVQDSDTGIHFNGNGGILFVSNGTTRASVLATGIDAGNNRIQAVGDPTSATDAANKRYVDAMGQGVAVIDARLATTGALPAHDAPAPGLNVLNATANGALTVDGVAVAPGDIILVKDEAASQYNGVWTVNNTGSGAAKWQLSRFNGMDTAAEIDGKVVVIQDGNTLAGTLWITTSEVTTLNTDPVVFTQFNSAADIIAGNGLTKTGNTLDLNIATGATEALEIVGDQLRIRDAGVQVQHIADDAVGGTQIRAGSVDEDRLAFTLTKARNFSITGDGVATTYTISTGIMRAFPSAVSVQVFKAATATDYTEVQVGKRVYVSGGEIKVDITFAKPLANLVNRYVTVVAA